MGEAAPCLWEEHNVPEATGSSSVPQPGEETSGHLQLTGFFLRLQPWFLFSPDMVLVVDTWRKMFHEGRLKVCKEDPTIWVPEVRVLSEGPGHGILCQHQET